MNKYKILFFIIILLAGTLRANSLILNNFPQGDIKMDSLVSKSLLEKGNTEIPISLERPYYYSLKEKGGRFADQHPPLWSILGAGMTKIFNLDTSETFLGLKICSLIFGILLIWLVYSFAKITFNQKTAILSAILCTSSYLLIDFSGNGSLYILQACLYILFLALLLEKRNIWSNIGLGIIIGIAYLTNYQTIILIPVFIIYLFIKNKEPIFVKIKDIFTVGITSLLLIYPWLVRNFLLFGSPFYNINIVYIWGKLGVKREIVNDLIKFDITPSTYFALFKKIVFDWFYHNLYYVNRKLFILAPISYFFFLFNGIETLFSWRSKTTIKKTSIFILIFFHIFISCVLPVFKFRYFVPILPLILIISSDYMICFLNKRIKKAVIVTAIIFMIIFSGLTYLATPSHTYYYDGALTYDYFNKKR